MVSKDPIRVAAGKKAAETRRRNQRAYDLGVRRIGREMEAATKEGNLARLEELEEIQMGGRDSIIEDYRAFRSEAARRGHQFRATKRDILEFKENLESFQRNEIPSLKESQIKDGWTRNEAARVLGEMGSQEFFKLIAQYYEEIIAAETASFRREFESTPVRTRSQKGMLETFARNNPRSKLK